MVVNLRVRLILILLVFLTLESCDNQKKITITGQVQNFYTNQLIGEVDLELAYTSLENGTYSTSFKIIDEFTTKADGSFEYSFDYVSAVEFRLVTQKKGYVSESYLFDRSEWKVNEQNAVDLDIRGASTVDVRLFNNYTGDQHLFKFLDHSEGCEACCESNNPYSFTSFVDTTYTCTLYSDQLIDYEVVNTSVGEASKKTGSIYIEPGSNLLEVNLAE